MDLQESILEELRYGRVKKGWYKVMIYDSDINTARGDQERRYIRTDFEIIENPKYDKIKVSGYFNLGDNDWPDMEFQRMAVCAGLRGQHDLTDVLAELKERVLEVYVDHTYKKGVRRDKAVGYRPCKEEPNQGDIPF